MVRTGKVVSAENGVMQVCFERPEACAHCRACGEVHESLVAIPGNAPAGSRIDVDMPEKQVLKASLLAYVIPLVMLLFGVALGAVLFHQDAVAAALGIGCMGLSWFILRLVDRRMKEKDGWTPRVIAVREEEDAPRPEP